jgi:hypothetical protein
MNELIVAGGSASLTLNENADMTATNGRFNKNDVLNIGDDGSVQWKHRFALRSNE